MGSSLVNYISICWVTTLSYFILKMSKTCPLASWNRLADKSSLSPVAFQSVTVLSTVGIHRIPRKLTGGSKYLLVCPKEFTEAISPYLVNRRLKSRSSPNWHRWGVVKMPKYLLVTVWKEGSRGMRMQTEPGARSWRACGYTEETGLYPEGSTQNHWTGFMLVSDKIRFLL